MSAAGRRLVHPVWERSDHEPRALLLLDRVSPDTAALARFLSSRGVVVRVADSEPLSRRRHHELAPLVSERVTVEAPVELSTLPIDFDVLFVDPYTSPASPLVTRAREAGVLVSNLGDVLVACCPCTVVGVTGSAGKSSTTALIAAGLRDSGRVVHYSVENPASHNAWPNFALLDALERLGRHDVVVGEFTNSHLEYMTTSPEVAVVTSLAADHVDWHGSAERYYEAKATLFAHQAAGDVAVLNADDDLVDRKLRSRVTARIATFGGRDGGGEWSVFLDRGMIVARTGSRREPVLSVEDAINAGPYLVNTLAALAAMVAMGIEQSSVNSTVRRGAALPHRRQEILSKPVQVIDDGFSMTPVKAKASLTGTHDRSLVWIVGGDLGSEEFKTGLLHGSSEEKQLVEEVSRLGARKAHTVIVFGDAGELMAARLRERSRPPHVTTASSLEHAVTLARDAASDGGVVLFCPVFFVDLEEVERFPAYVARTFDPRSGRNTAP